MNNLEKTNLFYQHLTEGKKFEVNITLEERTKLIQHCLDNLPQALEGDSCHSCGHFNAMLFNNFEYGVVFLRCRDCGAKAVEKQYLSAIYFNGRCSYCGEPAKVTKWTEDKVCCIGDCQLIMQDG